MFWGKKLAYYLFFMVILLWSSCANAMEEGMEDEVDPDSIMNNYITQSSGLHPSNLLSFAGLTEEDKQKCDVLERYFEETKRVQVAETCSQAASGIAGALSGLFAAQFFIPLAIKGLDLWVTKDVISADDWRYPAGMAILPAIAGGVAGYNGVKNLFTRAASDVTDAERKATQRPHSILESCTYSHLTQVAEMLFWEGLYFAVIAYTESNLDGEWGNPLIWDFSLGVLSVIYTYFFIVRSSNNPNKRIFRSLGEDHQELRDRTEDARESIRYAGLTNKGRALANELNIREEGNDGNDADADEETQPQNKYKYISILEKVNAAAEELPSHIKTWVRLSEKISPWIASAIEVAGLPMKFIISYHLPYKLLTVCGVSASTSMTASIPIAVAASPLVFLLSLKEAPLTENECKQLFWLFKPQVTDGYWWDRFAPLVARGCAFGYVALPVAGYLLDEVLKNTIGIENLGGRLALVVPFVAGTLWASSSKFSETQFSQRIANWLATGAKVNLACCDKSFRIFPCISKKRKQALETLRRVEEINNKVLALGPDYASFLCSQLKNERAADVNTPLLGGIGSSREDIETPLVPNPE